MAALYGLQPFQLSGEVPLTDEEIEHAARTAIHRIRMTSGHAEGPDLSSFSDEALMFEVARRYRLQTLRIRDLIAQLRRVDWATVSRELYKFPLGSPKPKELAEHLRRFNLVWELLEDLKHFDAEFAAAGRHAELPGAELPGGELTYDYLYNASENYSESDADMMAVWEYDSLEWQAKMEPEKYAFWDARRVMEGEALAEGEKTSVDKQVRPK